MNNGLNPSGGKENGIARRLGSVYLWISLFLAVPVGRLRDLVGTDALIGAWTAYVLTIPFIVFVLPYFLGAALLLNGGGNRARPQGSVESRTPAAQVVQRV